MSFRRDLVEWTRRQLARQAGRGQEEQIERLLRERPLAALPPLGPGAALPPEVRAASRPAGYSPPVAAYGWLCWPSADGAIYGWGEPYGPNPPLGTVQTAFSDTARIARQLDAEDNVTHGVNKIAGVRDWRSGALLLSWTTTGIYANGIEIVSGADINAVCVRYEAGTPYLIWAHGTAIPMRMEKQECIVENDIVTGVTGPIEFCEYQMFGLYWSEFSQDGAHLVSCNGSSVDFAICWELAVPTVFSGQLLLFNTDIILVTKTQDPVTSYTSGSEYSGQRDFLLKSQYIDNALVHARLLLDITETRFGEVLDFISFVNWGFSSDIPYRCEPCPGASVPWQLWFNGFTLDTDGFKHLLINQGLRITAQITIGGVLAYEQRLVDDTTETESWCMDSNDWDTSIGACKFARPGFGDLPAVGDEPVITYPYSPWPCVTEIAGDPPVEQCGTAESAQVSLTTRSDFNYRVVPVETIDARHNRMAVLNLGKEGNTKLALEMHRGNQLIESAERSGDYGYTDLRDKNDIGTEAELRDALRDIAADLCPRFGSGITGRNKAMDVAALDLTGDRAVQWVRAQEVSDGLYDHINQLENADVEALLSIDGEPEARIVIHDSARWFGRL